MLRSLALAGNTLADAAGAALLAALHARPALTSLDAEGNAVPYGLSQQLRAAVAANKRRWRDAEPERCAQRLASLQHQSTALEQTTDDLARVRAARAGRAQAVGELQAQLAAARAELEEVEGGAAARVQGRHAALKLAKERRREIEQASAAAKLKAQLEIDQKSQLLTSALRTQQKLTAADAKLRKVLVTAERALEAEGAELRRQVLLFKGRARSAEDSAKFKETLLAEKRANFKKKGLALRDYDEPRPELVAPPAEEAVDAAPPADADAAPLSAGAADESPASKPAARRGSVKAGGKEEARFPSEFRKSGWQRSRAQREESRELSSLTDGSKGKGVEAADLEQSHQRDHAPPPSYGRATMAITARHPLTAMTGVCAGSSKTAINAGGAGGASMLKSAPAQMSAFTRVAGR